MLLRQVQFACGWFGLPPEGEISLFLLKGCETMTIFEAFMLTFGAMGFVLALLSFVLALIVHFGCYNDKKMNRPIFAKVSGSSSNI